MGARRMVHLGITRSLMVRSASSRRRRRRACRPWEPRTPSQTRATLEESPRKPLVVPEGDYEELLCVADALPAQPRVDVVAGGARRP